MLTELQRLLPMAEKIIDRRSPLSILKEIGIDSGMARITDLESMLVIPVSDRRSYTIPVKLLKRVLGARPSSLKILLEETGKVTFHYDSQSLSYQSKDVADFPAILEEEFELIGQWPREIFNILLSLGAYTSRDELKPSLTGVFIEEKDGNIEASATDGHLLRLEKNLTVKNVKPFKGIIPVKPLQILARWARGDTKVGMSATHLRFDLLGQALLYTRIIDEKYPEIESVIPAEDTYTGRAILDRDMLLPLIKAAKPFAEKPANLAILSLNGQIGRFFSERLSSLD